MSESLQGQLLAEQGESPNENHDNCVSCYWFLGEICDGNPNTQLAFAQMSDKLADKIGDPDLAFKKVLEYKEGKITLLDIENFVTEHLAQSEAKSGPEKAENKKTTEPNPLEKKLADKFVKLSPAEISAIRTQQAAARAEVTANAKKTSEVTYSIQVTGSSIDLLNQGSGESLLGNFPDGSGEGEMNRDEYSGHLQGLIDGNFVIIDCYGADGDLIGKTFYEHNPEDGLVYCVAALMKTEHAEDQGDELKQTPNTSAAEKGKEKTGVQSETKKDSLSDTSRENKEAEAAAAAAKDQRKADANYITSQQFVPKLTEFQMSGNQWTESYDSGDDIIPALHIEDKIRPIEITGSVDTPSDIPSRHEVNQAQTRSEQIEQNEITRETIIKSEDTEQSIQNEHQIYLANAAVIENAHAQNVELQEIVALENEEDQAEQGATEKTGQIGSIRNPKLIEKIQEIYFGNKAERVEEQSAQKQSKTTEVSRVQARQAPETFGIQLATDLNTEAASEARASLPEKGGRTEENSAVLLVSQNLSVQRAEKTTSPDLEAKAISNSNLELEIEEEIEQIPTNYETGISLALSGLHEETEQSTERVVADADSGVNIIAQERKVPIIRTEKGQAAIKLETVLDLKQDDENGPDNLPKENEKTERGDTALSNANEQAERVNISRTMIEQSSGISLAAEVRTEAPLPTRVELSAEKNSEPQAIKLSSEHITSKERVATPEPILFAPEKPKQEPIELQRIVLELLLSGLEKSLQSLNATVNSISELGRKPEAVRSPEIRSTFNLNSRYPSQAQFPKQQTRRQPLNPKAAKVLRVAA